MSIKEKAKELAAGVVLMTAVATTGCEKEEPDYCVWSDWSNPHCGECKESICEDGICEYVPCEVARCVRDFGSTDDCWNDRSRDKLYSEREREREEDEKHSDYLKYGTYDQDLIKDIKEAMDTLEIDEIQPGDSSIGILKRSGIWCDDPNDSQSIVRCEYLKQEKQVEETKKKSELKSTAPKDICINNYLGAKYKKGKCEFPVYERMNGRAGLEKKFDSCQINKIVKGKGNTAKAHAVCRGVPSIINVKNYRGR